MVAAKTGYRCEVCAREKHAEIMAIRAKYLPGGGAGNRFKELESEAKQRDLQALMDGAPIGERDVNDALHANEEEPVGRKNTPKYDRAYYERHRTQKVGATPEMAAAKGEAPLCDKCGQPKTLGLTGKNWMCNPCRRNGVAAAIQAHQENTTMATPQCDKGHGPKHQNGRGYWICTPCLAAAVSYAKATKRGDVPAKAVNLKVDTPKAVPPKKKPAPVTAHSKKPSHVEQVIETVRALDAAMMEVDRLEDELRDLLD